MIKQDQYTVTVLGPQPPDIRKKIAAAHAEAVNSRRRPQKPCH